MNNGCSLYGAFVLLCACVVTATLTACPFVAQVTGTDAHDAFRAEQVAKIERNRTTKRQVYEWFGQPEDIVRKGTSPDQGNIRNESYFGLFADTQLISDSSIIYHYRNVSRTRSETVGGVLVLPVAGGALGGTLAQSRSNDDQHLWILFDERTGLVQDFVLKGQGAH